MIGDSSPLTPSLQVETKPQSTPEFDEFASQYDRLLKDPLRDLFATTGDFFHRRKWDLIQHYLASSCLDCKNMAWLDVGCGRGELLGLAGDSFKLALGCDPSKEMIGHSSGRMKWQPVENELPFAAGTFDLVTAVCVFHHVSVLGRPALLSEVFRVLKPGGMVCIIEHNPLNPITRWIVSRTPVDADARLLRAGETAELLRSARFQPIDTRYFLFVPEKLYAQAGRLEPMLKHCPAGGQYAVFARSGEHKP